MSSTRTTPEDHTFDRDDLLAPSTLHRPPHISAHDWDRMPWTARWKATRRLLHGQQPPAPADVLLLLAPTPLSDTSVRRCGRCGAHIIDGQKCTACKGRRPPQPCGTRAAYLRHIKAGEDPCTACVVAKRAYHAAAMRSTRLRGRVAS